jgi:hypothetical protein
MVLTNKSWGNAAAEVYVLVNELPAHSTPDWVIWCSFMNPQMVMEEFIFKLYGLYRMLLVKITRIRIYIYINRPY